MGFKRCAGMAAAIGFLAAAEPAPAEADPGRVERLIDALDGEDFGQRERAQAELVEIGEPALSLLVDRGAKATVEQRARIARIVGEISHRGLLREFTGFGRRAEERIDVEHGMWLIARMLDPGVEAASISARLDALADRARAKLGDPAGTPPATIVAQLVEVLTKDAGLRVNRADYDDPANSSVHRVLERGVGLQIILSEIAVAVGRRLDLPLEGITVPRYYTFRYVGARAPEGLPRHDITVDPYHDWRITEDPGGRMRARYPEGATARMTINRMLNNLAGDFDQAGDGRRADRVRACQAAFNGGERE